MNFTAEQKKKILLNEGYELLVGCCFSNPTDQDYSSHFVSQEEILKCIETGFQEYFYNDNYDGVLRLNEAWDCLLDDIYVLLDEVGEASDSDLNEYLSNSLKEVRE